MAGSTALGPPRRASARGPWDLSGTYPPWASPPGPYATPRATVLTTWRSGSDWPPPSRGSPGGRPPGTPSRA
eukprot:3855655-Alexandrium_andersonii.AAC.1